MPLRDPHISAQMLAALKAIASVAPPERVVLQLVDMVGTASVRDHGQIPARTVRALQKRGLVTLKGLGSHTVPGNLRRRTHHGVELAVTITADGHALLEGTGEAS